jgi:hypothetical protein
MGVQRPLSQDNSSNMQQLQGPIIIQANFIHISVLKYVFIVTKNFIHFMLSICMTNELFE